MSQADQIVKEVRAALERETRINIHRFPLRIACHDGVVTMEGEVENVAAKKLALEHAAVAEGVRSVDDRLRIRPAAEMEDAELCELVFNTLQGESAFNDFALQAEARGVERLYRGTPREPAGSIELVVEDGTVTLNGLVESYEHKALAGVLAWWMRGTRNVVNCLEVEHSMDDPDGTMTDALRSVLEKDRFLPSAQIRAVCRDFTVTLDGAVASAGEKAMAEADAWYLFGVNEVVNRLQVLE